MIEIIPNFSSDTLNHQNIAPEPKPTGKLRKLIIISILSGGLIIFGGAVGLYQLMHANTNTNKVSPSVPGVPTTPLIESVGSDAIDMMWGVSLSAASYEFECATDPTFKSDLATENSTSNSGTIKKLKPDTTYSCHVRGVNSAGKSEWSLPVSGHTSAWSQSPLNLVITEVSDTQLKYTWDAVQGATSYNVEYATDLSFVNNKVIFSTQTTSGITVGLKPDTDYYYHVQAITQAFDSSRAAFSGVETARTHK
jgi:fibronectin type 3 domain-containing protein